jgi:hypothetical protein
MSKIGLVRVLSLLELDNFTGGHGTGRHSAAVVRFGRADGSADGSPSSALRDHLPMTATSVEAH